MINAHLKILLLSATVIFSASSLVGQANNGQEQEDSLIVNLASYLPPLPVLIDSAIANAPQIEYFLQRQKMFEYEVSTIKRDWLNQIQLRGNYYSGSNIVGVDGFALSGYQYGISLRVPLGSIFNRSSRIKMAEAASLSEAAKRKEQVIAIQQEVEETYNRLFMLKELIGHATEASESAQFIYEQAENRFVQGELSLDELGQNTELKSKWATNYTTLKAEFYNTYRRLQALVGVPFSKFNLD